MVVQKTLDDLKGKPHDEKVAVASGVAIGVVVILLVGWGFLFLRKIQKGTVPTLETSAVPQDQFDTAFLKDTQNQIKNLYKNSSTQLEEIRDSAADSQVRTTGETTGSVPSSGSVDQFGTE